MCLGTGWNCTGHLIQRGLEEYSLWAVAYASAQDACRKLAVSVVVCLWLYLFYSPSNVSQSSFSLPIALLLQAASRIPGRVPWLVIASNEAVIYDATVLSPPFGFC